MNESFGYPEPCFLFSRFPVDSKWWLPSKLSLGTQGRSWCNSLWAKGWQREFRAAACTNGLQQRHCKSVALLWPRCLSGADSEILARDMALKPHSDVMSCQGNQVKLLSARWGAHFVIIWLWHCLNGCGELGAGGVTTHQLISHLPKHCF